MKSFMDKMDIPLTCPDCGHEFTKPLGWLDGHEDFPCPANCGQTFTLAGDELRRIRKEAAKLEKEFGKLGGTFKIKL